MEIDAYKIALKYVNNDWRKIKYRCVKNESASESNAKDRYDVARNMLLFDRKSVRSTEDIQPWKVLYNIKDFNLDFIVENVSNNEFMNDIVQDLHLLATRNSLDVAHKFRQMLSDEYEIFSYFRKQNMKRNFPTIETVVLLGMICRIYSTDATQHPVMLPAMIYMCDILHANFYPSYSNVIIRLYVCELLKNCISESRKFIPESIQFLKSVFDLALVENMKSHKFNLIITEKVSSEEIPTLQLFSKDKKLTRVSEKIGVIFTAASLTFCLATLYKEYPSSKFAFQPILDTLIQLPVHLYPVEMETLIRRLIECLRRETPPFRHLTQTTKPKSLKMFEPVFECQYESLEDYERQLKNLNTKDNKNKVKLNKEREKLKSVKQKIRKEERSLMKEIRRSAKTAAFVKLEKKLTLDAERLKKAAKIYNELAVQEHEFKKMMKKK
ncbi:nucleolar protein 14 homolog [Parasteatoda tepidariorum]|uniref:nucleolar protein 14 homolog n=1 Tax=Parasteatoda tepidariorum TaxID=114398 RepID=UPI00077F85CA|nr:nucleolar protein 14 homolog [Parasteatoda tepidariorum]